VDQVTYYTKTFDYWLKNIGEDSEQNLKVGDEV